MPHLARPAPRAFPLLVAVSCIVAVSCTTTETEEDQPREAPPTSVVVRPSAFLGTVACGETDGTLSRYQATLLDVTDGEQEAKPLPSSPVVSCSRDVAFHSVSPDRRYIARISAFDRLDVSAKTEGEELVVDETGETVDPAWTTTCWGYDGVDYSLGGAGGGSGAVPIGALAAADTQIRIGGCDPLSGDFPPELTGVSLELSHALGGLACGEGPGEVSRFRLVLSQGQPADPSASDPSQAGGGAGGAGGQPGFAGDTSLGGEGGAGSPSSPEYRCGETATRVGLPPGTLLTFNVEAFTAEETSPSYSSACRASLRKAVISKATCDPLSPLE